MTSRSSDTIRAALLLTNRLVRLEAAPLNAREFWQLTDRVDLGELLHASATEIGGLTGGDTEETARLRALLDAATAMSFEQERLADGGIDLVSALDERFPVLLRERLGSACPPFLLVAGPIELLGREALGVVGSRDAGEAALDVARRAARVAARHGWPVVSGLARGVDQEAMAAALAAGGRAVGVPAEGIQRAARNAGVRRGVHSATLCIASPYAPDAPFRAGNAIGRNKIIYALSKVTLVITSERGRGGTWAGAKEALDRRFAPVAVWSGEGAGPGNDALARRGAASVADLKRVFTDEIPFPDEPVDHQALF